MVHTPQGSAGGRSALLHLSFDQAQLQKHSGRRVGRADCLPTSHHSRRDDAPFPGEHPPPAMELTSCRAYPRVPAQLPVSCCSIPYIGRVTVSVPGDMPADLGAVLRVAAQPDNAGADTFDRYEWQAMMATVDLLSLYMDAVSAVGRDPQDVTDCGLVCEYHEDWARVVGGEVQLVSCKHKEPGFGAFTTARSLLGDGGIYHLFDRWHTLGRVPTCRLVTTAGLDSDARAIGQVCTHFRARGHEAALPTAAMQTAYDRLHEAVAERMASAGGTAITDLATHVLPKFLAGLTFECGVPRRDHLPSLAPTAYADPIARALGRPALAAEIWEAVLSLVRSRMRAAGPARRGLLHTLAPGGPDELERRTITVADAHIAISAAIRTPGGFAPLPRLVITNKLAIKMSEGRCAATSIDRAEILRKRFAAFRRDQRSKPGAREAELALELTLRRVADRATGATRNTVGQAWGSAMWTELENRLTHEAGAGAAAGLDADMLLGGVADLANNCKVWFSEPFDAQARVRGLREGRS